MCGTTRAWLSLLAGDVSSAFRFNPLFWFWGFLFGLVYMEVLDEAVLGQRFAPAKRFFHFLAGASARQGILGGAMLSNLIYLNFFHPV